MAVQAQYPSNAFRAQNGVFEELQNQSANLLRGYNNYAFQQQQQQQVLNGTVFSDLDSGLTCNASGSRKRNRIDQMPLMQQQQQQILPLANLPAEKTATNCSGMQLSYEENRFIESAATSTSGRSAFLFPSLLSQDVISCIYHQNVETDNLIRLQNEKLRLGLDETRKRHLKSLLSVLEQQIFKRLKEKELELDSVRLRNAELEEKVKQMSAENQIWCHVARNNEAMVSNLRTSLEQVLLHNSTATKEGYGDSCDGMPVVADDAQSCCHEGQETDTDRAVRENRALKSRRLCKVCRENDVSVLLLPCRHLCLCKECESRLDSCPICKSVKNASLQIFMS